MLHIESCKSFDEKHFLSLFDRNFKQGDLCKNCQDKYSKTAKIFKEVLDCHVPMNQALFRTKEPSKAVMSECKGKSKYTKWPSREKFPNLEKLKIIGVIQKAKKQRNNVSKIKVLWGDYE